MKKTICVISGYRSDYTKLKSVMRAIDGHEKLNLKLVVFGAHTLEDCGDSYKQIIHDGFEINEILTTNVQGSDTTSMTKSMGLALIELSSVLVRMKPTATLIVGDRYEIAAAAMASTVNNIPVIHIQGGELSGTIDETLRHSVTKLSHLHFPSTEISAMRIIQLGENPNSVFNVGCPAVDYILSHAYLTKSEMKRSPTFSQFNLDYDKDYALIIQHPVTLEYKDSESQMTATLEALQEARLNSLLVYPNPDTGAAGIVKAIRKFDAKYGAESIIKEKVKNLPFKTYLNLLKNSKCLVGNSSSGIREAHIFNTPVINIGDRQEGRERTNNVVDVSYDKNKILDAISRIDSVRKHPLNVYGDGTAGQQMAEIISKTDFSKIINKRFYYV